MEQAAETLLLAGLAWIAFKALVTVLLLLGAGPVLRHTPLAPIVLRIEAHPLIARLRARLPWPVPSPPRTPSAPGRDVCKGGTSR